MGKIKHATLFDVDEKWKEEWNDMPEYSNKDLEPYQTIMIHFKDEADRIAFAKLIGQKITYKTKSLWYPPAEIGITTDRRWIDKEEVK